MSKVADYYLELEDAGLLPEGDPTPEDMETPEAIAMLGWAADHLSAAEFEALEVNWTRLVTQVEVGA